MVPVRRSAAPFHLAGVLAAFALTGCGSGSVDPSIQVIDIPASVPACDETLTIASDSPALLVHDPEALKPLSLEKVLESLLDSVPEDHETTPLSLLQRLFDTSNVAPDAAFDGVHCSSNDNNAHVNGPAAFCPRAEGALAFSDGLLTPGHADFFYPVAVVNRFDLMPLTAFTCGEYRIVFAKTSGLQNPDDRVFLIFEISLPNPKPGSMLACRPVLDFWKSLEQAPDKETMGQELASFFLEGLPGFGVPVTALNLGLNSGGGAEYYGATGQVRLSQHMDEHWEMRQMSTRTTGTQHLRFDPVPVGNNPLPALFGPVPTWIDPEDQSYNEYSAFAEDFAWSNVQSLAASRIEDMTMITALDHQSGESALGGDPMNDYPARAAENEYIQTMFQGTIDSFSLGEDCPEDDPLTADSIVRRATMLSCAGCHSPERFLGPERKLGCGLTWPASSGEVHIDERGDLSPALKEVFLPKRAHVLETYLQACDEGAILEAFGAEAGDGFSVKASRPRTLGGHTTH